MSVYTTALNGLAAQSRAIGAIAQNIANAGTTGKLAPKPGERGAYAPIDPVTLSPKANGVIALFDPDSPDANDDGLVAVPDISLEEQLTGALVAKDNFKANAKIIKIQQEMDKELLNIIA
ncbi:MAG: putative flagellar basal-body rod protein FlgC [Alphaproteobacteria bacterium]|nr:putative flagellar basal-body rod protein FlgC [Alphaproteobacteria bacterium]